MHHSLFYDDLETNSSLLKSAKGKPKGYHPTPVSKRKLHCFVASPYENQYKLNDNECETNFELKNILKNDKNIKHNNNCCPPTVLQYENNALNEKITCFDRVIRPCVAELVAVFFCIFIAKVMEYELMVHIMISNNERIIMQALTDSVTVVVMILAFHTVHLSPVITLVELFALTTAWPMCFAIIFIQIIASFVAITVFAMLRFGNLETQMARIVRDVGVDSIGAEYHLVLSQFIGTLLVVTSHLLTTTRTGSGLTAMSRPAASPLSVAAAVFISSLLCLLNSTIGWNPLLAFALASYGSISCNFTYLKMQGIFWIGPCLASLFACFLYRLLFVVKESRLMRWSPLNTRHI